MPRKMPEQGTPGTSSRAGIDHTDMANSTFPMLVAMTIRRPTQIPAMEDLLMNHRGGESPPDRPRGVESSCVVSIRRSLATEGISEEPSKLIFSYWRSSTEGAYSCWRRWEKWCT